MLYMRYVLKHPVDFSSRTTYKSITDIRSEIVTVSKEKHDLAGVAMQTHDQVEELQIELRTISQGPSVADTTKN
ncbi:hypothetical protein L7F22_032670 [Adiantum nelumboides]|nr:hypothetical protein [Adiantum nelumboides]